MVLHLLWRVAERGALPLVREGPGFETGNILQQGTGERCLVKLASLATEVLSDVVVGRNVRNGPRRKIGATMDSLPKRALVSGARSEVPVECLQNRR